MAGCLFLRRGHRQKQFCARLLGTYPSANSLARRGPSTRREALKVLRNRVLVCGPKLGLTGYCALPLPHDRIAAQILQHSENQSSGLGELRRSGSRKGGVRLPATVERPYDRWTPLLLGASTRERPTKRFARLVNAVLAERGQMKSPLENFCAGPAAAAPALMRVRSYGRSSRSRSQATQPGPSRRNRLIATTLVSLLALLGASSTAHAHLILDGGTWSFRYFSRSDDNPDYYCNAGTGLVDPIQLVNYQYGELNRMYDHIRAESDFGDPSGVWGSQYICATLSPPSYYVQAHYRDQTGHGGAATRGHMRMWFNTHGHDWVNEWSVMTPHHEDFTWGDGHVIDEDWENWELHVATEVEIYSGYCHNVYYHAYYRYPGGLHRGFYQNGYMTRIGGLHCGGY
jgi:hypothetical protein